MVTQSAITARIQNQAEVKSVMFKERLFGEFVTIGKVYEEVEYCGSGQFWVKDDENEWLLTCIDNLTIVEFL